MIKVATLGAFHKTSDWNGKTYNNYYLVLGRIIDEKEGFGYNPMTVKVDYDRYKEFIENTDKEETEIEVSYEYSYDKNGNGRYILTGIKY